MQGLTCPLLGSICDTVVAARAHGGSKSPWRPTSELCAHIFTPRELCIRIYSYKYIYNTYMYLCMYMYEYNIYTSELYVLKWKRSAWLGSGRST